MNVNDEALAIAQYLGQTYQPQKIILFGSVARGKIGVDSDVDLLIVKEAPGDRIQRAREVYRLLWKRGTYSVGVDVIVITPKELTDRLKFGDPFYGEIVTSGRILYQTS